MLDDRVAVITGSGRGIGRALALKLASEGAKIVVNGTTQDAVDETVDLITAEGNVAVGIVADVQSEAEIKEMIETAVGRFGKLDILVNNAGVARDSLFDSMDIDDWQTVLDINLRGPWLCAKHAAPAFRANGYGRVINIGAEGSMFGNVGQANYVAAKAGLLGLTMVIARELGRWGRKDGGNYTCNLVMPGMVITRMNEHVPEERMEAFRKDIVLGRVSDAREDLGPAVAFLASPGASYITGAKFGVNGGLAMQMMS